MRHWNLGSHHLTHAALTGIGAYGSLAALGGVWAGRAGVGALLARKAWKLRRERARANRAAHATLQTAFHSTRHPPTRVRHPVLGTRVGRNSRHAALRTARRPKDPFPPPPPGVRVRKGSLPQDAQGPQTFRNTLTTTLIEPQPQRNSPHTASPSPGGLVEVDGWNVRDSHTLALFAVFNHLRKRRSLTTPHSRAPQATPATNGAAHPESSTTAGERWAYLVPVGLTRTARRVHAVCVRGARSAYTVWMRYASNKDPVQGAMEETRHRKTSRTRARRRRTSQIGRALQVGLATLISGVRAGPKPTGGGPSAATTQMAPAGPYEPPTNAQMWARALDPDQSGPAAQQPPDHPKQAAPVDRAHPREKPAVHRLQIVSYNVGSIGGDTDSTSMRVFLAALRASRYDVALVQEHKIPEKQRRAKIREAFSLGFLAVLSCNGKGKAKGGTGIFVRISQELVTMEDIEGTHSLHGLDGGFTKAAFLWAGEQIEVASIYSPAIARPRELFLSKLARKQRSESPPLGPDTVLGGDFNSVPNIRMDLTFPPMSPTELKARRAQYENKHSDTLEDLLTVTGLEDILRTRKGPKARMVTRPGRAMAQHNSAHGPNRQVSSRIDRFYVPTALPYEFHPGIQSADTKNKHGKDLLFPSDHIAITLGISRTAGAARAKYGDEHISRAALESREGVAAVVKAAEAHFAQGTLPGRSPVDRWEDFKLAAASALVKVSADLTKQAEDHQTSQEKEVEALVADLHIVEEDFQHLHRDPEGQGKRFDILEKLATISRKRDVQKLGTSAARHTFSSHSHGHFYLPFKPRQKATTLEGLYTVEDWTEIQGGSPLPTPAKAKVATSTEDISSEVAKYYSHLYSKRPVESEAKQAVLESIAKARIPERLALKAEGKTAGASIEKGDVEDTMKDLPRGSSPGPDLLGNEFYAIHRDILAGPLTAALNHASNTGALPTTMLQGSISVLYKKKDRKDIRNYRPITLLNCDYKILTRILNARLLGVLKTAAAADNTGFVPGRSILDNTRLLALLQAAVEEEQGEGALVFLDFEKAFDSVSHELLVEAIDRMGFGPDFKKWVGLLYNTDRPPQRRTVSNGKRSAFWSVHRGVAQGDPLSPALYLCVAEALTRMANEGVSYKGEHIELEGIRVGGLQPFRVSQFADDSVMLLADTGRDLETMWRLVEVFEKGTGMRVNKSKTEGLQLGRSATDAAPTLFASTGDAKYTALVSATQTSLLLRTSSLGTPDTDLVTVTRVYPSPQEAARAYLATRQARRPLPFEALLKIMGPNREPYYCLNATEAARDIVWCKEGEWLISLGIPIGRDFDPGDFLATKVGEIRSRLTRWNGRLARIPTTSRVQLVNSLLLSRVWYWAPVLQFPAHVTAQLTALASKTIWTKNPHHNPLRTPSPGRQKPWIKQSAAGRRRAQGGLGVVDIRGRVAAAQADSVARLFDHGTGRWKELLLHFLSRASRGAPYGRDLLLSTVPTSALQKALSGTWLSFWREAIGHFKALDWQKSATAGPEALCSSLVFADRHTPPPTVRDPRVWERTLGIVRARDAFHIGEGRFRTFEEVLEPWRRGRDHDAIPKGFRKRNGFAELNGGGGLEPKSEASSRAEREWAAIVKALTASHGSSLRAIGSPPKAGALVACGTAATNRAGANWFYGHLVGPTAGRPDSSQVIRICLGPNGLQAPHNSPEPVAIHNKFIHNVAKVATRLGVCILGPESYTYPHPETWVLAKRGAKASTKSPPALHSRRISHIYAATQKNARQAPASEKKWAKELARTSTHLTPKLEWHLIYRGTHPALLTPADSHQLSKMVHRGIFTNSALPTLEERRCRLGCSSIEHMSHLAICRSTGEVRTWALRLIRAIDELPALPWAHGLVPFFCLGLAPPPECKEDCDSATGCTCLAPLSAGGYTVLALTLRHIYAGLTKVALEDLPKLAQLPVIKATAEALRDRICSYFTLTKRRLIAAENRGQDLDVAKEVRRAGGNLLKADSELLAIHPAVHSALKEAGVEMPKTLRWRHTPPPLADPLSSTIAEEATQQGPLAGPLGSAGADEATQQGYEAAEVAGGEEEAGPGLAREGDADEAALRSADAAAQRLLSRSPARQATTPRRSPARARRSRQPPTPASPDREAEIGSQPELARGEVTPQLRRKKIQRRQRVDTTQGTPSPIDGPQPAARNGPESPALTPTPTPGRRRTRSPERGRYLFSNPASPSLEHEGGLDRPEACPPTTAGFPFRLTAHKAACSLQLPEIISGATLSAALERLDRSEARRMTRLGSLVRRGVTHASLVEEVATLKRTALCHRQLRIFKAGATWGDHQGTTATQYSQPGGVGRHVAQHTQLGVEALGPGQHASASLGSCPREVRTLLTCHILLDLDIANALPCIASQLDILGLAPTPLLEAVHAYSANRDAYLTHLIEVHKIVALGQQTPRDIAKALPNSILFGSSYSVWTKTYAAAIGDGSHREETFVRLEEEVGPLWEAVEKSAGEKVLAAGREAQGAPRKKGKSGAVHVFTKALNEIESCILHTAAHFLSRAGWTVHSMQQDGLLVRPPTQFRPEQGTRPGRELVTAAETALDSIARQVKASIAQPAPEGLGIDVTLVVKELYGIDPEPTLRSFD